MWLTIITIQVHVTVHLCAWQLVPTGSHYSTSMWFTTITIPVLVIFTILCICIFVLIKVYIPVHLITITMQVLCYLRLSLYRFILQNAYVTFDYHHAGSYYCTSMWLTISRVQVHITASLCDLLLSPYRFILQHVYVTYHYHHTGSYYCTSMWLKSITKQIHITGSRRDLQLSLCKRILQYVYVITIITIQVQFTACLCDL
jgi:hypothetical protein